jgi:hypothetical protein
VRVLLLHGPGEVSSRKKLIELKNQFNGESFIFEGDINEGVLRDSLSQKSLFAENRLIILENPSETLNLKPLNTEGNVSLVIWLAKEIAKTKPLFKSLDNLKAEILFFPEGKETSVFPFLDMLADGKKEALREMKRIEKQFDFHYLIVMIFYLLRQLIYLPKTSPPFVQKKVQRQRERFPLEKITSLYKEFLVLNYKVNSGLIEPKQAIFLATLKFTD